MDVRCEKCQTEYELDEQRLKPGGVTVKCTNCGHMFKIRKRTTTNAGVPVDPRARTVSSPTTPASSTTERGFAARADSILAEEAPAPERQWIIRLENGEQKSCRELATLQQWIVACVVSRESLISRTGKTWKRLGDISELAQYFEIADEARTTRRESTTKPSGGKPAPAGTMLGFGTAGASLPTAAGGTIVPDDEDGHTTGSYPSRPTTTRPATAPPPLPGSQIPTKTPPMGSNLVTPAPIAPIASTGSSATRRPLTTPPPPPARRSPSQSGPLPAPQASQGPSMRSAGIPPVPEGRGTAVWATDQVKPSGAASTAPFVGKLAAISDEPAFAGRVRVAPSDESSFDTGRVRSIDDDEDEIPGRRGSRSGIAILLMTLLVGGAAAFGAYFFLIKKDDDVVAQAPADAATDAAAPVDGALVVSPVPDAAEAPEPSPLDLARGELATDDEARLTAAYASLAGKDDPASQALRAHLGAAIAQGLVDRAALVADKGEADKLRKQSKTLVIELATLAQKAHRAAPEDAAANLAMAEVLRLQGKPARDIKRYADTAKAKAGPEWARDVALAEALVLARDGKLDDAKTSFAGIDQGENKLETSNDVRARFQLARLALAQNRPADAKELVDQVLAAQPEHASSRALAAKLETAVAKTDPLPPEEPGTKPGGSSTAKPAPDVAAGGGSYDQLLARANALGETNCSKAIEIYGKALEQKPNGVEALTGMGYCHIDAKQFASAFSKFRAALAVSSRYEPALWGVAEAYQQQGRKEQAIESFRAYLEVYPDSAKAKKQLDRLGGNAEGGTTPPAPTGTGGTTPPATQPTPPPTPAPAPTPAPTPAPAEGAGSGA